MKWISLSLVLILLSLQARADVVLRNEKWSVAIDPSTLKATATVAGDQTIPIAAAQSPRGVTDIKSDATSAHWRDTLHKTAIDFTLDGDALTAHFVADETGSFTWPTLTAETAPPHYILPLFEGVRVPADDAEWAAFLEKQSPLDTTAGLSMPFFATQHDKQTITYLLTNPFNNELTFKTDNGKLGLTFAHQFTRNHAVKEYAVRVIFAGPSDVEPAKIFRHWLQDRGEFVSYKDKIAKIPNAEKLLGAAHVYLWGNGIVTKYDLIDAAALSRDILSPSAVGTRITALLDDEGRALLKEVAAKKPADMYDRSRIAEALDGLLERTDFYNAEAWKDAPLPAEATAILQSDHPDTQRLNSILLYTAFPDRFKPIADWGDGFSVKMVRALSDAGLDRLWLGSPDWKGLRDHPDFVKDAIAHGYLVGPYDSFHSIHSPSEKDAWETAQFDRALYESGPIIKADGSRKRGFKQKGFILSPLAARPEVEARVRKLMGEFHCNSWFIDCDAFGEVFDDYSPEHPATQADDMRERLRRMAWIRDTFGAVIGSEFGSSFAAGTIHFAHGMMTPDIGWGDPDLKDRKSPYFMGGYYPPDGPAAFFKQVPMKPVYRRVYADPQFRIPLYQTALHDSIVTTHQWGSGSLKFTDPDHARELLELLYDVPPLYHLNLAEWAKRKAQIVAHYQFFSPLHRQAALLPMTDWQPLTADRLVQRTAFGGKLEMIANFGNEPFAYKGQEIPRQSVLALWSDGQPAKIYSPSDAVR